MTRETRALDLLKRIEPYVRGESIHREICELLNERVGVESALRLLQEDRVVAAFEKYYWREGA